jgi:hypothetical protein
MSDLREKINAMRVRASSPDQMITAELSGRSQVTLSFAPGWYGRCTDSELGRKLSTVASQLWVARMREYWTVRSRDAGEIITSEPKPISPRAVAYRKARSVLVARGRSADGSVSISVEGMRSWTVTVAPGTVRVLDEREFAAAAGEAAAALIQDQYQKVATLKAEIYQ